MLPPELESKLPLFYVAIQDGGTWERSGAVHVHIKTGTNRRAGRLWMQFVPDSSNYRMGALDSTLSKEVNLTDLFAAVPDDMVKPAQITGHEVTEKLPVDCMIRCGTVLPTVTQPLNGFMLHEAKVLTDIQQALGLNIHHPNLCHFVDFVKMKFDSDEIVPAGQKQERVLGLKLTNYKGPKLKNCITMSSMSSSLRRLPQQSVTK